MTDKEQNTFDMLIVTWHCTTLILIFEILKSYYDINIKYVPCYIKLTLTLYFPLISGCIVYRRY